MEAILAIFTPLPGCRFSDVRAEIYFAADCPDSTPEECAREDARRYGASVEIVPASAWRIFARLPVNLPPRSKLSPCLPTTMTIPDSILSDWRNLVASIKPTPGFVVTRHDEPIDEKVYPTEEAAFAVVKELGGLPYGVAPRLECLTVGYSPQTESWGHQTGDNSFTGGAYGHRFWGVVWIGADADPAAVARELADEIEEQMAD